MTKEKHGKVSIQDLIGNLNKKAGHNVAFSLEDENPSEVKDWIPTGSRWLDCIIAKGMKAGIPTGKIVEIAGLEATGKSYMAAQIVGNAQQMGIIPVYLDSESAIQPEFLSKAGVDIKNMIYVQAENVEFVLETIESLIANAGDNRFLFVWDSVANTQSKREGENDEFNPQASVATTARVISLGMRKLCIPIANGNHTFLALNQLKTQIPKDHFEARAIMSDPYFTPGGKALNYAYSLRIWLTGRKAKSAYVQDQNGYKIGSEVKAKLKKSRFGTEGRECTFKILWGGQEVKIQDEESWFEAIQMSSKITNPSKGWFQIEGFPKFRQSNWGEMLQKPEFKEVVLGIMDNELIHNFETRQGNAKNYYDIDGEEDVVAEEDNDS